MYPYVKANAMPRHTHTNSGEEPWTDARCCCGSLLARLVPGGVELKCRRCHRLMLVPVPEGVLGPPQPVDESAT